VAISMIHGLLTRLNAGDRTREAVSLGHLYLYFIFLHSALIAELLITGNKIILSRRGAHLGRQILCPLVKFYIMTTMHFVFGRMKNVAIWLGDH